MKSLYFSPTSGSARFEEINDKLKEIVSEVTEVITFPLGNVNEYFPDNYDIENFPDIIFVPTIFDSRNPMTYDGVNFAIRWYFHFISKGVVENFRVVLLGIEEKASFFQHCNFSNFLKCPNVYYIQNSMEEILPFLSEQKSRRFDKKEALKKIDDIGIKPPNSYKTHHSISNEWSILRWSNALNLKAKIGSELEKNETNIKASLFYKYLSIKYPIASSNTFAKKSLKNEGTIVLIDDEVEKGWGIIFEEICKNKEFRSIGGDFKKINDRDKIVEVAFNSAKDADVIILDLRLHDDDFEEIDPKKLTGFELLKRIKDHNKGIQVIIFSASNKIWNLQELQEVGIDGFILKESPENSIDEKFTNHLIENIYQTIDKSLDYSFVKKKFETYNFLKLKLEPRKNPKKHVDPLPKLFVDEYLRWLDFGISNILKYKSNTGNVMSFLIFFTVLENISNRLIDIDNPLSTSSPDKFNFQFRSNNDLLVKFVMSGKSYVNSGTILNDARNLKWNQKILNSLNYLSCDLPNINSLIQKRNDIIHSNSTTGSSIKISNNDLQNIFKIITKNIENIK